MKQSLEFLRERITDKMPLEEMVAIFEDLCREPIEDEEFYQVHLDVFYEACQENQMFHESTWDEDLEENIFDYIRDSEVFKHAKEQEYQTVKIYLEET